MIRYQNVLLIFDSTYHTPRGHDFTEDFKDKDWITEKDVYESLVEIGFNVSITGLFDDISVLTDEIKENKSDVVFNLTEVFNGKSRYDKNVASILEMSEIPFTGASPASMLICNDKALSKKIFTYHKVKTPRFLTFRRKSKVKIPKRFSFPLIVKPLHDEASRGISQASVVDNEKALIERVQFIYESQKMDAIVEEYIDGREFYVSVLGNKRIEVLPYREMKFGKFPQNEPRIATYKAKWDNDYRKKWGIKNSFAGPLSAEMEKNIKDTCKRAYRALNMKSYARFDVRLTADNMVYILEANANPSLEKEDEFANSAAKTGLNYTKLVQKIIDLAFQREK